MLNSIWKYGDMYIGYYITVQKPFVTDGSVLIGTRSRMRLNIPRPLDTFLDI